MMKSGEFSQEELSFMRSFSKPFSESATPPSAKQLTEGNPNPDTQSTTLEEEHIPPPQISTTYFEEPAPTQHLTPVPWTCTKLNNGKTLVTLSEGSKFELLHKEIYNGDKEGTWKLIQVPE